MPALHFLNIPQDLLLAVALYCSTHSQIDVEVIIHLTKLRLKTKPNISLFLACIRDLCSAHKENLPTILNLFGFPLLFEKGLFIRLFRFSHAACPQWLEDFDLE